MSGFRNIYGEYLIIVKILRKCLVFSRFFLIFATKTNYDNISTYDSRNNRENQYTSSLVSILKENGDQFYNMFFLLLTDLINKGKTGD